MSAIVIGSPSPNPSATNSKVLRRQQYQKDINGLETLSETYLIQTQNLIGIIPRANVLHKDFSTATNKYSRMVVESVSSSEMDGGLTELNVSFVGLTSESGLPPAVVRILPVTGAGVFGPPINIEAEFVTDVSESELVIGKFSSTSPVISQGFGGKRQMPAFINGTQMPANPVRPFDKSRTSVTTGALASVAYVTDVYLGYVIKDIDATRRGNVLVARCTFEEFRLFLVQ